MTNLKPGDEVEYSMGAGLRARLRVKSIDPETQTGEMEMIKVIAPPRPRYVRGHRPQGNALGQCVDCWEPVERVVTGTWLVPGDRDPEISYYRHARRNQPQTARDRTHCSVCGAGPRNWSEFDASGRGVECQP